jgi:hypothetical protein
MQNLPVSIRVFFFGIPLVAAVLLHSWNQENQLGLRSVYSFLELGFPSLQEKYSWDAGKHFSPAVVRDSLTIGRIISKNPKLKDWSSESIRDLSLFIVLKSEEFQISPYLILSLIQVESAFDAKAISPKGAIGLMQLMPSTAEAVAQEKGIPFSGVTSLEDPKLNIYLALHYIKELKATFPQNKHMLTAYNMGPSALQKKLKNGDDFSNSYYEKVMGTMVHFQREARRGNRRWL